MNKYILTASLFLAVATAKAQSEWEIPTAEKTEQTATKTQKAEKMTMAGKDVKYLAGAVSENNGKVAWSIDLELPNRSAQEIYNAALVVMQDYTKGENQLENSSVALVNKNEHIVVAAVREWLEFSSSFISLDRAKLYYNLIARCSDGRLNLSMERINFLYSETNGKQETKMPAETQVSDKIALNKKKTKFVPGYAKFRRKLIDRKDLVFETITKNIKEKLHLN